MPRTRTDPVTERHTFILARQEGLFSTAELCARFGISRTTGYKWLRRYRDGGVDALRDQSRAPKRCPHRTPEPIRQLVIEARQAHPRWDRASSWTTSGHATRMADQIIRTAK